jgi:Zn-dependent protease with chaperone function
MAPPDATPAPPTKREIKDFRAEQRRHRIGARLRAVPALLAAAVMGVPLSVYLSPLVLAILILALDVMNFFVPMPDLAARMIAIQRDLFLGDPGTIRAMGWLALLFLLPGLVGLACVFAIVRRRLQSSGGDEVARSLRVRPSRSSDHLENRLVNIVTEYSVAAGIRPPQVWILDPPERATHQRSANALTYGMDPDHAHLIVGRDLLTSLDREQTQGIAARLVATTADGDLGLMTDIGAVYVTYGLVTTLLAAVANPLVRPRLRSAIRALRGRPATGLDDHGLTWLVGLPVDDIDSEAETKRAYLSVLTMSSFIGAAVSMLNLFVTAPLLTLAWRSRVHLADAVAVDLTRNPTALARALRALGDGPGIPGSGWLELSLVVSGRPTPIRDPRHGRALSDATHAAGFAPSTGERVARLEAMGARDQHGRSPSAGRPARRSAGGRPWSRPTWRYLLALGFTAAYELVGLFVTAVVIFLIGAIAFVLTFLATFFLDHILRTVAGRL